MNGLSENTPDRSVCIMGMGFVGVTLAAVMARLGFKVTGVEIRADLVNKLNAGQAYFFEPGLTEQLTAAVGRGSFSATCELPEDLACSVYIITVGTPLGPDRRVDLTSITQISRQIAGRLKDGDMVILRSTVRVGVTRSIVAPILQASGKSFDLAFCPERTVEGQAMAELRVLPQIIGADTYEASLRASRLFQHITPTVVRVSDIETAEMIKLVDNSARDLMFAYANEVAHMCDSIGVSADEVIRSGRFGYSRTGLPKPGLVGGPCLSKDPLILCESLEPYGVDPVLTRSARRVNETMPASVGRYVGELVAQHAGPAPKVSILGVAFKGRPATDDIRGTTVPLLTHGLAEAVPQARLYGFDPIVPEELIRSLGLEPLPSLEAAFENADAVIIHTEHAAFASMAIGELTTRMERQGLVYDFWNLFTEPGAVLPEGVRYIALGSHARPITGTGTT